MLDSEIYPPKTLNFTTLKIVLPAPPVFSILSLEFSSSYGDRHEYEYKAI